MITLHDYQRIASDTLIQKTKTAFASPGKRKEIFLKAITGAGKTVIMADYINRVFEEFEIRGQDVAVVWMSIGTGGLHMQSYGALRNTLPIHIQMFDSNDFRSQQALAKEQMIVLNWEALRKMKFEEDGETPIYENLIMKDGEKISLPKFFEHTRNNNVKLIMIIDEAHIGIQAPTKTDQHRTKIIKNEIDPTLVINVTATPKFAEEFDKRDIIEVDTQAVIQEGRIKRGVRIDDTIDTSNDDKSFVKRAIMNAVAKQKELRQAYIDTGNRHLNPLCILQIPNATQGEVMKKLVEETLAEQGYSYAKENLAEIVSDTGTNMETIRDTNSRVSFIIAKQAISTGWDVPRAQILVKLRDTQSPVFDAQTLGRILRMPDGRKDGDPKSDTYLFFTDDRLNYGYVYTDKDYTISVDEYQAIFPVVKHLKEAFKEDVLSLTLPSHTLIREREMIRDKILRRDIEALVETFYDESVTDFETLTATISAGEYRTDELEIETTIIAQKNLRLVNEDVLFLSEELLQQIAKPYVDVDRLKRELNRALSSYYGEDILSIRKWILANAEKVSAVMSEMNQRKAQELNLLATRSSEPFTFPESSFSNAKIVTSGYEKCAYTKQAPSRYDTEKAFEKFLEESDNVLWWIKNADSGQEGLSLYYEDPTNQRKRLFFPDYVIRYTDGSLGIQEVKARPDLDEANTLAKKYVLQGYLRDQSRKLEFELYGGVVYMTKSTSKSDYTVDKATYEAPED